MNAIEVICLTNNPVVFDEQKSQRDCIFVEGGFWDVLQKTRDLVHEGHTLISHPLGASIRMMYSPYRSLLISKEKGQLHEFSVEIIESSMENYKTTMGIRGADEKNAKDYATVDHTLFQAAMQEMKLLMKAGQ